MRILSVGPFPKERNNTSCHRSDWLRKHADCFKEIDNNQPMTLYWKVIYHLGIHGLRFNLPDTGHINDRIKEEVAKNDYDIVWIDKGNNILPSTLRFIKEKQPECKIVHYMIDDFMNPYHTTRQILDTIPLYDYYIVNRKANIQELKERNCKHPVLCYMSYESNFHHPYALAEGDKERLGGEVGFIGTYEKERAESMKYLADNGITVRIFGGGGTSCPTTRLTC